jgi:putative ABC transport system permease protein
MIHLVNLWFAILGLGSNKLRSALTMLGVIIGVGAVIMIVSLGNGLRRSTQEQMEAFSRGIIEVRPGSMSGSSASVSIEGILSGDSVVSTSSNTMARRVFGSRAQTLSVRDAEALQLLATSVAGVVPQVEAVAQMIWKGQTVPFNRTVVGVPPEYLTVYGSALKYGRFFNSYDEETAQPVVVLESALAEEIFGAQANPVGETVQLVVQNVPQSFVIVGVLQSRVGATRNDARSVLVPLQSAIMRLSTAAKDEVSMIAARVDSREQSERSYAVAQINTILRARHGLAQGQVEDYNVRDTLQFGAEAQGIISILTLVLSTIAGISLVVGSIGLMNIMLVSVSERTWEIGLRRALGARQFDVLSQFLSEASLLSLLGGFIGMGLGVAGSYGISQLIPGLKGMVSVTPEILVIAVSVSMVVGIVSGIYPAWRAALLPPTGALRRGA